MFCLVYDEEKDCNDCDVDYRLRCVQYQQDKCRKCKAELCRVCPIRKMAIEDD